MNGWYPHIIHILAHAYRAPDCKIKNNTLLLEHTLCMSHSWQSDTYSMYRLFFMSHLNGFNNLGPPYSVSVSFRPITELTYESLNKPQFIFLSCSMQYEPVMWFYLLIDWLFIGRCVNINIHNIRCIKIIQIFTKNINGYCLICDRQLYKVKSTGRDVCSIFFSLFLSRDVLTKFLNNCV